MQKKHSSGRVVFKAVLAVLIAAGVEWALHVPLGPLPPVGVLFDPVDGLYRTARNAVHPAEEQVDIPALERPVRIVRDARGVPHIFAENDRDAIIALGYVVAQDRLFQLDFIPRVAAGRLSEAFGASSVGTDQFLRRTGMDWAAHKALREMEQEGGLAYDLMNWYASGVNAFLDGLDEADLPFEFRLLGYRPDRYSPLQTIRLQQYMNFDLSYGSDAAGYTALREELGEKDYRTLFPRYSDLAVPIIPERGGGVVGHRAADPSSLQPAVSVAGEQLLQRLRAIQDRLAGTVAEGFRPGKGSNNWAVGGSRSATGAPILAGDMHLRLSLPAIWYEVHLVTPTMNTYGVTIPGSPLPVEAFNDYLGWTFTNTGSDQVDHYALELDASGNRYRFEDGYRDLARVPDTIYVKGGAPVLDTLYYAHWGPVTIGEEGAVAVKWVAHEPSRTMEALWGMNHARDLASFEAALRTWDSPMQNILYADAAGNIAIRSTGYLPVRKAGHGIGLLDGTSDAFAWTGRVPFEELPHSRNPGQGFLTSTNQQPADSTYPHYLGHDWRIFHRSIRIHELLTAKQEHSVDDLKRYQADVHAVQRDLFVPFLDTLSGLSPRADTLRRMLARWDGTTSVDRPEPLVLEAFMDTLGRLAWDEPVLERNQRPSEARLYYLIRTEPASAWLDVQETAEREHADGLLRLALEAAVAGLEEEFGWDPSRWRWGDHHRVEFRHLTQTPALRALWRSAEYPGFAATLSPARSRTTTHGASWRMVVDFSRNPPEGFGIYPGGQSGNPFSATYALHVPDFVAFRHYRLHKPSGPEALTTDGPRTQLVLRPGQ